MSSNKLLLVLTLGFMVSSFTPFSFANSLEVDGPGFNLKNKTGWFGNHSASYSDALGNGVSQSTNIFGRTTTKTQVFGTQAYKRGQNISVSAANGSPLLSTHRSWFGLGGRNTRIDGNNIIHSMKGLFNSPTQSPLPSNP